MWFDTCHTDPKSYVQIVASLLPFYSNAADGFGSGIL